MRRLLARELRLSLRHGTDSLAAILFFLVAGALFPLAIGPAPETLARLSLSEAPIWLLDEPTLGLDTASIARLGAILATHRDQGGLVLAATHLPLPLPRADTLRMAA